MAPGGYARLKPVWQVVVLSWNSREDTLSCLESACRATGDPSAVVCVDNASADGSPQAVRTAFPGVTLIEAGGNLGFAGGNNLGLRRALEEGADWVVLLNNDARIDQDAIAAFSRAAARHPAAGILAGKLFYEEPSDRVWFAGQRFFPRVGYSGRARGWKRHDRPRYRREGKTGRAAGALMAVSRRALEEAGFLDEELFLYVEDVDISLRVAAAGFEVVFVPDAVAWHKVSASTGGEELSVSYLYYATRNTVHVCEANAPLPRPLDALRRAVIRLTFSAHALTKPNRGQALAAVGAGYRDAVAGRLGPRQETAS